MMNWGKCQVEGYHNKANCGLYKTDTKGHKVWLNVCSRHEIEIGDENLQRIKGG